MSPTFHARTPRLSSASTSSNNVTSSSPFHFSFTRSSNLSGSSARSSRSRRRHHRRQHSQHQRMPLNILGADRRDVWRTCFCFHVRTVTIFIGVWYLMVYILLLSLIAAIAMYEANNDGFSMSTTTAASDLLPTPVSKTAEDINLLAEPLSKSSSESSRARMESWKTGPLNILMDSKKANSQYALLTICNMLITLLMVYGAVRGKPSYLMPFFVLKVFDFCIFCLTMVGYFSYLPNVTEVIANQPNLPFREELLRMDPQLLSLLTLMIIVGTISMKAYVIGVIWNCYKYLMLRNTIIRGVISYRHDDPTNILGLQQNLLPDLPDYDTAINDPRYAKKPLDGTTNGNLTNNNMSNAANSSGGITMAIPPPPYSVAVSTTNETVQTMDASQEVFAPPFGQSVPRETEPSTVPTSNAASGDQTLQRGVADSVENPSATVSSSGVLTSSQN